MSVIIRFSLLSCVVLTLAACTTSPKKTTRPAILSSEQAAQLKNTSLPKNFPIPVQGVKAKALTDTWGASRSQGRSHEGIDIMAPRGTKVYSTTDGIVASMKGNNLGGTVIWMLGPNNSWHYYAHLSGHRSGLKEGDFVSKGTLIGYVGNTGNARHTAPHLHYGLYLSGKGRGAVNPYPYLR
ncbi:peptidase M23-like protein [Acinetobacter calcoaceticus]|uniref:Peptidase M23-like protein n=1 Tax=Acinetobacter calcoaceticus TaxID=471 RepID=A0A4R1XM48_ACICA|nr:peptidase M23-like protein [Acinetobacter calcoaceticus]